MEVDLIYESVKFMVLGMGVVFSFLTFLVLVLKLQAKIISKYFPDPEATVCKINPTHTTTVGKSTKDDGSVVAAITAAVIHHRK